LSLDGVKKAAKAVGAVGNTALSLVADLVTVLGQQPVEEGSGAA
jgi:hypothetical protein